MRNSSKGTKAPMQGACVSVTLRLHAPSIALSQCSMYEGRLAMLMLEAERKKKQKLQKKHKPAQVSDAAAHGAASKKRERAEEEQATGASATITDIEARASDLPELMEQVTDRRGTSDAADSNSLVAIMKARKRQRKERKRKAKAMAPIADVGLGGMDWRSKSFA